LEHSGMDVSKLIKKLKKWNTSLFLNH
jgi:hypothetical protein